MAHMVIKIEGVSNVLVKLDKFVRYQVLEQGIKAGFFEIGETIMTDAKRRTPVDLGNLRASGHATVPKRKGSFVTMELGFGGPAGAGNIRGDSNALSVGYAEIQHETLWWSPANEAKRRAMGTGPFFLKRAVAAFLPTVPHIIAAHIRNASRFSR